SRGQIDRDRLDVYDRATLEGGDGGAVEGDDERVIGRAAGDGDEIDAGAAVDRICAVADGVDDGVVAIAAVDRVATGAAVEGIVAARAAQDVGPAEADEGVLLVRAGQGVGHVGARKRDARDVGYGDRNGLRIGEAAVGRPHDHVVDVVAVGIRG